MTHTVLKGLAALALAAAMTGGSASASDGGHAIQPQHWTFSGVRGHFDNEQLKRGFQVYKEVCSTCHGINRVSFRNLGDKGGPEFPEDQVKGLAATYKITDGPNEAGKMFKRPGRPSDRIPNPYANTDEARSVNRGALPPDFSLIAKARGVEVEKPFYMVPWFMLKDIFLSGGYQEGGPDYLYALLTSYKDKAPAYQVVQGHLVAMDEAAAENKASDPSIVRCASMAETEPGKPEVCNKLTEGMSFNTAFSGHQISMPPPLASDGLVKYTDGTPSTRENYARDVSAFLAWAADPKLEERKRLGLAAVIYLLITSVLLYIAKQRVWAKEPH